MPKIDEMFAFVVEDTGPNDEGVVGVNTGLGWMPLVGADMSRVDSLKKVAQGVANTIGKPIKILRFEKRSQIDVIAPDIGKREVCRCPGSDVNPGSPVNSGKG